MSENEKRIKRIVLIASVKAREEQLKLVISRMFDKVDEIHLVLNWYEEVPEWLKDKKFKIITYLNSSNKNAHDSIWNCIAVSKHFLKHAGTPDAGCYYFVCDDDLLYPEEYFDKLIDAIERHERKAVVCCHGSNILTPVADYMQCRSTYGFSDELERDIFNDLVGCGTVAFHSSTIKPTLQDFPIPYCRDLFFSVLCAKNGVKIVNIQRPSGWILPLKTPGETVYDLTLNNKNLQRIKNRILKEQLLPLLHCDRSLNRYCLITDYAFDQRLLNACLNTLNGNVACNVMIFTDDLKNYPSNNVLTQFVTKEERDIGRMGSKVVTQYRMINSLPTGSQVISADADLYFLADPFTAFEQDFDIAVTTRSYKYQYPINGGVVMFRVNDKVKRLLAYLASQVFDRTWQPLINFQKRFGHTGNDWYVDQDIWCAVWENKDEIQKRFGVKVIDIGPKYNYCPHADGQYTEEGKSILMKAYNEKAVAVLHLKSRLKELLLDGLLE